MTTEEYLKELSDERLVEYAETAERYLVEHPEPEILKGRSQVRKWASFAREELARRKLEGRNEAN